MYVCQGRAKRCILTEEPGGAKQKFPLLLLGEFAPTNSTSAPHASKSALYLLDEFVPTTHTCTTQESNCVLRLLVYAFVIPQASKRALYLLG